MEITQHGVAVFLNRKQHYALLTKKIFDLVDVGGIDPEISKLSDFIICFDFSSEPVALKHFERDLVVRNSHLSPTVKIFTRLHIEKMILGMVLVKMNYRYLPQPELKQLFNNFIEKWDIKLYWDIAIKHYNQ